MPKAKYRLHATKVDRIAIVDRPAVPNAQILLFKRKGSEASEKKLEKVSLEKALAKVLVNKSQFGDSFIYGATNGAVDALEASLWNVIIQNNADKVAMQKAIDDLFMQYKSTMSQLSGLAKTVEATVGKRTVEKGMGMMGGMLGEMPMPSCDELVEQLRQSVASQSIQNAFQAYRNMILFCAMGGSEYSEGEQAIGMLTDELKNIISQNLEVIVPKMMKDGADIVTTDKIGRKISSTRMAKLKEALSVLTDIIKEQEGGDESLNADKRKEKGDSMTLEQITKAVETLKTQLAEISAQLAKLEEGKKEKADKAEVEKSIAELKAEVEALKSAVKTATEALKPLQDGVAPLNEKMEKMAKDLEGLKGNVEKMEKSQDALNKGIETIGKRFGVKTSVDVEKGGEGEGQERDVFADALRGKKV